MSTQNHRRHIFLFLQRIIEAASTAKAAINRHYFQKQEINVGVGYGFIMKKKMHVEKMIFKNIYNGKNIIFLKCLFTNS